MAEMTVQSLSIKLQYINRNYLYTMPDWLKIMFTVTSTVIAIIVIAVIIYGKKSGNCLLGKYLQNNRKKTDLNAFELRKINKPHGISTSHPLTCRSTANSCHALAQIQLPQLPNTFHDQPDSPLLQHSSKGNTNVRNVQSLKLRSPLK